MKLQENEPKRYRRQTMSLNLLKSSVKLRGASDDKISLTLDDLVMMLAVFLLLWSKMVVILISWGSFS